MKKILIAGLGVGKMKDGKYEETCYKLGDKTGQCCLLPSQLLADIIKPDRIYFVGTKSDKQRQGSSWNIPDEVFGIDNYKRVEVPHGLSESDWWKMLSRLTSIEIEKGDEIYLDITHGFRSLPLFCLMALIYFEKIYGAKTCGIYYGIFEHSSEEEIDGKIWKVTPIVDLSPIIRLKDWIEYFSLFVNYGDAAPLANLMRKEYNGNIISDFAGNLEMISSAFGFNYVKDICNQSKIIWDSEKDVSTILKMDDKPGGLISSNLFENLKQFTRNDNESTSNLHLRIARWYLEHRRFTQCVILLAELTLTYLIEMIGGEKVFDRNFREKVSRKLIGERKAHKQFPTLTKFLEYAFKLNQLRNQTAHADMREDNGMKLNKASNKVLEKFNEVKTFIENREISEYLRNDKKAILDFIEDDIVIIDVEKLYEQDGTALIDHIDLYTENLNKTFDYKGKRVMLTGKGPIWLYLRIAHFLHGHAARLEYTSPLVENVTVFDHTSR